MKQKTYFLVKGILLALLIAIIGMAAQPAAASCGGTTFVSNQSELNAAIAAYNAVPAPPPSCVFTIQLTADINLTASTTPILNTDNSGNISLVIEGAGFTVNGLNTSGVRPFTLDTSNLTPVTINQITITGGYVPGASGGGIQIVNGHLTVTNSTITGNRADAGGGISVGSLIFSRLTLQNSTISGNRADINFGGGILTSGPATIDSSTIVNNQAVSGGGGALGATGSNAAATVTNSILANSTAPGGGSSVADCAVSAGAGTVTDGGYNLVETPGSCSFTATGSITGQDPLVLALADNGGPTQTHALNDGSPALEQIPVSTNGCGTTTTTDQRNEPRPGTRNTSTNRCEIGAWEAQTTDPTAITMSSFSSSRQAELPVFGLVAVFLAGLTLLVGWLRRQPKQISA